MVGHKAPGTGGFRDPSTAWKGRDGYVHMGKSVCTWVRVCAHGRDGYVHMGKSVCIWARWVCEHGRDGCVHKYGGVGVYLVVCDEGVCLYVRKDVISASALVGNRGKAGGLCLGGVGWSVVVADVKELLLQDSLL